MTPFIMNPTTTFSEKVSSHRIFPKHFMDAFVHFIPELVGSGVSIPREKINPAV